MNFYGTPTKYDTHKLVPTITDPIEFNENEAEVEETLISSGFGIYIPQMFTDLFEKEESVSQLAWDTCKKGPSEENEDYWSAWAEILDTWEYFRNEGHGCSYRYFLSQDEGLCLMRQFIDQELD